MQRFGFYINVSFAIERGKIELGQSCTLNQSLPRQYANVLCTLSIPSPLLLLLPPRIYSADREKIKGRLQPALSTTDCLILLYSGPINESHFKAMGRRKKKKKEKKKTLPASKVH